VQAARPPFNRAMSLDSPVGSGASVRNVNAFSMLQKQNLMGGSPRMTENQESFGANIGLLTIEVILIVKEKALKLRTLQDYKMSSGRRNPKEYLFLNERINTSQLLSLVQIIITQPFICT